MRKTTTIFIFFLCFLYGFSQTGQMMFGDTSRIGVPFAKDPHVISFDGRYLMYFSIPPQKGIESSGWNIGIAESRNLIEWRKIGEITTEKTNFNRKDWKLALNATILSPELPWEGKCIEGASITIRNNKMYMFYAGAYNNWPQQVGVAESEDGIKWKRLFTQPFLPNGTPGEWNESESGHPHIFTDTDGRTYLFFQGNNDKGKTWHISNKEVFWKEDVPYLHQ